MVLKNGKYLFLLVIVLLAFSCGSKKDSEETSKKNNVIKAKSYYEVSEVDFSNKDIDDNTLQNVVIEEIENSELTKNYERLESSYRLTFFPDIFHSYYKEVFLDSENNFIIPDEQKISSFSNDTENIKYEELLRDVHIVKNKQKRNIEYKNEELNKVCKEFYNSLDEKIKNIEEIRRYYKNKKYKEDNFEKGKILSEQYFANQKKVEESFKNFYNERRKIRHIMMINTINVLKEVKRQEAFSDILKLNLLKEMFYEKFVGTKLYFDTSKPFVIEEKDEVQYINELKSIQKTLENLLSDMKKTDVSKLEKENINVENYKKSIEEIEKISKKSRKIIDNIEKGKNENVNQMISDYLKETESAFQQLNLEIMI